jgi:hypothetical protein
MGIFSENSEYITYYRCCCNGQTHGRYLYEIPKFRGCICGPGQPMKKSEVKHRYVFYKGKWSSVMWTWEEMHEESWIDKLKKTEIIQPSNSFLIKKELERKQNNAKEALRDMLYRLIDKLD